MSTSEKDLRNARVKAQQLGMPYGTARNKLNKAIMFSLIQKLGRDNCHQCGSKITSPDNLSVEHMTPWLYSDNPVELFFDLDNIAFSHHRCNCSAARVKGTKSNVGQSGYKGVWKAKRKHGVAYNASIHHDGRKRSLGVFEDPKDAARAYDKELIRLFGDEAVTNQKLGLLD